MSRYHSSNESAKLGNIALLKKSAELKKHFLGLLLKTSPERQEGQISSPLIASLMSRRDAVFEFHELEQDGISTETQSDEFTDLSKISDSF